jgi:DNA polymerase-1
MTQRTIAVIDGNSFIHRAFHALPETMTAPDGRPTNAAFGFVSMLVKLVQDLSPDGVVVAFDRGKPAFRLEALEQYKVHRPPTAESLKAQFPMVKGLLKAMNVPMVEVEGWEGDDILGTLAAQGTRQGMRVLLVTGDRDAFQLVDETVRVVTTKKGITDIAVMGPQDVVERYGVTPAQVPDYLGLKGDTSDNIPGVKGIGEKTAAKLLQEFGTLEAVLAAAEKGEIAGKVGENLREHVGAALASRTVATIVCDVPVDIDLQAVTWGGFDAHRIAAAFAELRFTSLLERVLATAGGTRAAAPETAVAAEPTDASWRLVSGADALERVRAWAGTGSTGWVGVEFAEGAESLFDVRRDFAAAHAGEVALVEPDAAEDALAALLAGGRIASADAKTLLEALCPAGTSGACDTSFDAVDPARVFDVAIAAYLLESARSSYALDGLAADYLGAPPARSADLPQPVADAQALARLAPELERRLAEDGSDGVFDTIEMPLVPVLARMERVGIGLNPSVLEELGSSASEQIDAIRAEIYALAGCEFTIDSPKQLGEVLFDKLGLPRGKRTKTGWSTDASVLGELRGDFPIAGKVLDYRELTKLRSTYIEALPRLLGADGRIHTSFNQTVAATGRLSSSNPNLQNIPVRTELGRRIRAAFVPAEHGDVIVSADYSQIELRILAHLSGDRGLIEAFTSGADFHAATASRVYGVPVEELTPQLRARAKAVNFGIVYGQTAHGLADSLKIPHIEAQGMIDRYYAAYPGVDAYLKKTVADAYRDGFAVTMFGRKRRIPELRSSNHNLRSFGERTAMNHPMQGSAADIMKLAMIEVDRRLRAEEFRSRMVLQVHDELVFEAPAEEVGRLSAMVVDAMGGVADISVPLEVSVASGPDWASAK